MKRTPTPRSVEISLSNARKFVMYVVDTRHIVVCACAAMSASAADPSSSTSSIWKSATSTPDGTRERSATDTSVGSTRAIGLNSGLITPSGAR